MLHIESEMGHDAGSHYKVKRLSQTESPDAWKTGVVRREFGGSQFAL
jgi:hypothetical protein